MSGSPQEPNEHVEWTSFITPMHRSRAEELWHDVYKKDLLTQSSEWKLLNGHWSESYEDGGKDRH